MFAEDCDEHAGCGKELVDRDDGASDVVFVPEIPGDVSDHGGEDVRGRSEELGLLGREAHAFFEYYGKEITVGIAWEGRGHQVEGPKVELPVFEVVHDDTESDWIFFGIAAVGIDTVDDEGLLVRLQESFGFGWEVDDDEPPADTHEHGKKTFDDEYP